MHSLKRNQVPATVKIQVKNYFKSDTSYINQSYTLTRIFAEWCNMCFFRQLGYHGGVANAGDTFGGKAYGPVHVTNVNCTGEEEELLACGHQEPSPQQCGHDQNAGVTCHLGVSFVFIIKSKQYNCHVGMTFVSIIISIQYNCHL